MRAESLLNRLGSEFTQRQSTVPAVNKLSCWQRRRFRAIGRHADAVGFSLLDVHGALIREGLKVAGFEVPNSAERTEPLARLSVATHADASPLFVTLIISN